MQTCTVWRKDKKHFGYVKENMDSSCAGSTISFYWINKSKLANYYFISSKKLLNQSFLYLFLRKLFFNWKQIELLSQTLTSKYNHESITVKLEVPSKTISLDKFDFTWPRIKILLFLESTFCTGLHYFNQMFQKIFTTLCAWAGRQPKQERGQGEWEREESWGLCHSSIGNYSNQTKKQGSSHQQMIGIQTLW